MQTLNRAFNPHKEDLLAKETRAEELRFRLARYDEGKVGEWKPAADLWFAVKAAPGSQRSPSAPANDGREPSLSLIERNLANAGFESFMPTYRIIVKHHRNKKLIERRFPIFTGYVFVNLPTQRFVPVEAVEGVGKLLKYSRTYGDAAEPFSFPQEVIDRLRYMVWEEDQKYLLEKACRMRQEEVDRELAEVKKAASRASRKIRNAQYSELPGGLARSLRAPSSRALVMQTMDQLLKLS
ncbi:transcription termination/antitermination NusG family protein [Rhizobium mesoamericanum]|uniref:transcription termination/antitermination NusG family protein n=1 Tax=Rhizobium mesoamericanum TaxID=1079800 RepID=UPI000687AB8A|nr:transcription termination/antitermination NusG family protein [Rhizobium mesoamericanum]